MAALPLVVRLDTYNGDSAMTPEERDQYIQDHLNLYMAEEMISMYRRVEARMMPHLIEIAMQDVAEKVVADFLSENPQ